MKNRKTNLLLIACAIIIQRLLFQTITPDVYEFPFASSLMIYQSQIGNIVLVLYAFIPIPFILFEFSGKVTDLTKGYGKLWIIRSCGKERLYLKMIRQCAVELFVIVLYQTVIFGIGAEKFKEISLVQILLTIAAYYIGILALILLQLFLEFFFEPGYADLFINIFFVVSIFVGNCVMLLEKTRWIGIVLFPNMIFGTRNGIIHQNMVDVKHEYVLIYLFAIIFSLSILSILKFRKKDVF